MPHQIWKYLSRFIISCLLIWGFAFISIQPGYAQAETNFATNLETNYIVSIDGSTRAEYQFTITNLTPTVYVERYAIRLQQTGLTNISATNDGVEIQPNVTTTESETNIALEFPDPVVGQGKQRQFTIQFDSPQLATITGKVLEVRIPEVTEESEYQSRKVKLITPSEFGKPHRISPDADSIVERGKQVIADFSQLNQQGVVAIYGREQVFQINLRYFLDNPTGSQVITQIALPPTTSYQQLNYQTLEPRPSRMIEDLDGNWLAEFALDPHQELVVNSVALAKVSLDPYPNVPIVKPQEFHLKTQEYWPVENQQIKQLVAQYQTVGELYQLAVDSLTYTTEELEGPRERLGAIAALEQADNVVCQEYTDLFVTLARSKGIPARRVAGYAVAEDRRLRPLSLVGDVLHSWADYYDAPSNQWRNVDPTWQSTTGGIDYFSQFDLNHIAFVMNGQSSTLPYPAGFYKRGNEPTQDVVVEVVPEFVESEPKLTVSLRPNQLLGINIPGWYTLHVTNQSGQAWYQVDGLIEAENNIAISPDKIRWRSLLPFETKTAPVFLTHPGFNLTRDNLSLSLQLGNHEQQFRFNIEEEVSVIPGIFESWRQLGTALAVAVGLVFITLTTGSLLVFRQRRQGAVRGQSQAPQPQSQVLSADQPPLQPHQKNGASSPKS